MAVSRKSNDTAPTGVNLDRLKGLADRWDAKKSTADDARSDLGTLAKEVEDLGFNRPAFKLTMKLRGMEPDKRNDFLSSLNAYCDFLGVFSQGDLFGDTPTSVGPTDNEAYEAGKKVGRHGDAISTNPHDEGSSPRSAWDAGWQEGQADKIRRTIRPDTETQASA